MFVSVLAACILGVCFLSNSSGWVNACEIQLALDTHLAVCLAYAHCVVELKERKLAVDVQNSAEGWRGKLTWLCSLDGVKQKYSGDN